MNKLTDYIISLTHLYGLVHKEKVIEIFNMQNEEQIVEINNINTEDLTNNFIIIDGDYFVHETIMEYDEFEEQLTKRKGKPFYIPKKEELLKYKEDSYYEITKEYKSLLDYVTTNIFNGDNHKAEMLCENIQGYCEAEFSPSAIFDLFNERNIIFDSDQQVNEVIQLVMELANNTRIWGNNGHTHSEILELMENSNLTSLPKGRVSNDMNYQQPISTNKVGRNAPCPCGSGKKYKKCCLN